MKKTTFIVVIFLLGIITLGLKCAWSQAETGALSGTVTDQTGAVVPSAAVTVKSVATGALRSVQVGSEGQYQVSALPPGIYNVSVTSSGFAPYSANVEVTVGGRVTLDPKLSLSATTETVEVIGAGGTAVNTQTQELSQVVDTTQMAQLPSLDRNPYDFVALAGNVSNGDLTSDGGSPNPNNTVGESLTARGVGYSINGQRETGTEILLDGVENVGIFSLNAGQPVPVDSIQEFSIITNNFGADFGRASGGVVDVDSKQGTNAIHGSAYEFNRLSAYTANTYGNDVNDVPKGSYARNQFGYNAGGPIIRNKLFGFFSEEFVRVRSNAGEIEEIPDPTFISLLPANIQNYFKTYGAGSLKPSGTVTTAGQLVAAGTFGTDSDGNNLPFPMVNGLTTVPNSQPIFDEVNFTAPFDAGGGLPQNTYDLLGRLDYTMNDSTQMFFRFARYSENDFSGSNFYSPYPQYDSGSASLDNSSLFSLNHLFSPNVLSSSKISFARYNSLTSYDTSLTDTPNLYLSTNEYAEQTDSVTNNVIQLPGLQNTADGSGGLPYGGPQNTLQLMEDVSWTKGRHTMHFGGQFTYIQLNVAYGAYNQANEVLGSDLGPAINSLVNAGGDTQAGVFASPILTFEARVNAEGALPCATDAFGNSIATASCSVTPPLPSANPARSYRYKDWALYAGDSFHFSRNWTFNYAVRYEHYGVQHNNHQNLDSNFYPGSGTYPEDIADGGVSLTPKSSVGQFWAPRWGTVAPRVGFAWDIFGSGRTSLRGGFGISYERNFGNVTYNASFNPPASAVLSDVCSAGSTGVIGGTCGYFVTNNDLGPLGQPGPSSPLPPVELRDDDAHINVAQTQFWSLALQHELTHNTVVEADYSGAHGVHLYDINNVNPIGAAQEYLAAPLVANDACPYADPLTNAPVCYTRPNSAYAAINDRGSFGSSAYDALNLKFQTQDLLHTGLTIVTNYTWAHSLDDLSSTFSESETAGSLGYTDFLDPKLDWGSSDFDVRNRLTFSPIWQTPWFKTGRGVERQALGGWTISSIFTARTGIPFSIYDESYLINDYEIPRLTPSTPITQSHTGTPVPVAGSPNLFTALTTPAPNDLVPFNTTLDLNDFGPFPKNMTHRNSFRGPGAWNDDLAIAKTFAISERFGLEFRAEGFNLFNHHNYYVNAEDDYIATPGGPGLTVMEEKGGLGSGALGGNHDERRFGQFSLRLSF
jgi:hypothetical protein